MLNCKNEIQQKRGPARPDTGTYRDQRYHWVLALDGQLRQAGVWPNNGEGKALPGASLFVRSLSKQHRRVVRTGPCMSFERHGVCRGEGVQTSALRQPGSLGASYQNRKCAARTRRGYPQTAHGRENPLQARPRVHRGKYVALKNWRTPVPGVLPSSNGRSIQSSNNRLRRSSSQDELQKRPRLDTGEPISTQRQAMLSNLPKHSRREKS